MTDYNLPDKDDALWLDTTYDGFKIQQQSFYNQLWELLETELGDTVLCDQMADRIYDLVNENYEEIERLDHPQQQEDN